MLTMDKRYVLRKPIEAHYVSDSNEWYIEILGYLNNGEFDEMFVEFSFDATRKQIEEIIQSVANEYFKAGMSNYCMSFNRETFDVEIPRLPISQFVDRVLALLGGTTNE